MNQKTKGMLCIIFSAFCFAVMNVCIRMAGDVPSMQKSFFRNFLCFFLALIIMKKQHIGFSGKKGNIGPLLARSIFGLMGVLCNFYAVDHLVLADASMLNKMSPFFAILLSFLILKERIKPVQAIAVVGAFVGCLLVIKPTGLNLTRLPALIGLMGGFGAGMAYTFVRMLGTQGEKGPFIVSFFSGFSTIVLLPFLIMNYTPMTGMQLFWLLMTGAAACGGQFGITQAYCYASAKDISIFDYSQILFSAMFGLVLFGQIPDGYSILGYIIVCSMAVWMFFYQKQATVKEESGKA